MNKKSEDNRQGNEPDQFIDPVCGMSTEDKNAYKAHNHKGKTLYFCSDKCLTKFKADPDTYKDGYKDRSQPPTAAESAAIYSCPMHPEVEQLGPGACPKCGMALESLEITLDAEDTSEYDFMWKRFLFSAIFSIPLVIIAMREMLPGGQLIENLASARTLGWIELFLSTPVILWAGWVFYVRAVQSVVNKSLNMFTLIGLGVSMAYGYSLVAVLLPDIFPAAMRGSDGSVGVYFEAAAVITNDTDLVEPIRIVAQELQLPVGLIASVAKPADGLNKVASFIKHIREGHLKKSQFPNEISDKVKRPIQWV